MKITRTLEVDDVTLPRRVEAAFEGAGKSVYEVCSAASISTTTWYKLIKGEGSMSIDTLCRIATALGQDDCFGVKL